MRAPDPGETPLSRAEVKFAADVLCMFDEFVHVHRPAGTWERNNLQHLAKPGPWDGLL